VAEVWNIEADISVINNGGLRTLLPKGAITLGKVYEISPFENYLYILELSPEDVKTLAHYTVQRQNLSISGMHLKSSNNQLEELLINGRPLDTNKTYLLAINDYLANGGDDMPFLIPVSRYRTSTTLIRDVIITKIKALEAAGKMVDARLEGRQLLN
jgi:2',3'-cyclic-nucleotide 2'-phosphodiesterase (5'-nucleotidase family)